jgi:dsDNA-specific endonuclease/ATPase MutS2
MGTLQKTVRSILDKNNSVLGFQLGNESNGGWGSTSFQLKPLD